MTISIGFEIHRPRDVWVSSRVLQDQREAAVYLRHALELAWLMQVENIDPVLAGMAAARTAALFAWLEGCDLRKPWLRFFLRFSPPIIASMKDGWDLIATYQPGVRGPLLNTACDILADCWSMLGPVEILMQRGGDNRLNVNSEPESISMDAATVHGLGQ